MKFKKTKPEEQKRTVNSIQRPAPYQYRAVRSDRERRENRGTPNKKHSAETIGQRFEKILTLTVIAVILGSFLYLFWLNTSPNIRFVEHEGSQVVLLRQTEEYESGARDLLNESVFSRTKLTFNSVKFSEQLKKRFPEIATATVTIPLTGHKPLIDIQAKEAKLLLLVNGVTYVIDQDGVAVARLSELNESVQSDLSTLRRAEDQSGLEVEQGRQVMTSETLKFALQIEHQYVSTNKTITKLVLPGNKPNEFHIYEQDSNYFVKYVVTRPASEQYGANVALQELLAKQGKVPAEYIDVRVEGKAFYK